LSQTISKSSLLENMYREIIYNFITTTFFIFCQNVKSFVVNFRSRDVEALKLMKHFDEFLRGETSMSPVFSDKWVMPKSFYFKRVICRFSSITKSRFLQSHPSITKTFGSCLKAYFSYLYTIVQPSPEFFHFIMFNINN